MIGAYSELVNRMKNILHLKDTLNILYWDMKTYMPEKAIRQRSESLAYISRISHEYFTSEKTKKLLDKVEKIPDLNSIQKRNLFLWNKDFERETKLPTDLVQKLSQQLSSTEHLWVTAKAKKDFNLVKDELKILYELVYKKAQLLDENKDPYNNLLDLYEPNIKSEQINKYFNILKDGILKLVEKCEKSKIKPDNSLLNREVTLTQQKEITRLIMDFLKMDPSRSRVDETEHPFTTGYADDVRITTHYLENDLMGSFYSVFHEAGHALYELNLPKEYLWTPVGSSIGLGIHESQSRFVENIIGKGEDFLTYVYPKIQKISPSFKNLEFIPFLRAINQVKPSKIRIYADEVTYSLHIILRYEIERDLFDGKINIQDLPEVWNKKMEEYLDQKIENDTDGGVLQDTHWYGGAFGYFPDYALGNIYDGQLLHQMQKDLPEWKSSLRIGNCQEILNWLDINIHKKGSLYDPIDLIKNVTGSEPQAHYFVKYLNTKFSKIYEF